VKIWIIFLGLLMACNRAPTPRDIREKGQEVTCELLLLLKKMKSREDLYAALPSLETHFLEWARVMKEAEEVTLPFPPLTPEQLALNDELKIELQRIYKIEGGRQALESSQHKALQELQRRS